jgi:hypothetical protein
MAIANVVLNTKTYTPVKSTGSKIDFVEASGGIPTGFSRLSFELRNPQSVDPKKGSPYRAEFVLDLPVVAASDSDCACTGDILRWEKARVLVELPQTGTTAERTDFALRLKDLAANAQFQAVLTSLTMPS